MRATGLAEAGKIDPNRAMPANLTPQYKDAERRYRQAVIPEEQVAALGEMLALIPKHKGTEKLQADIKRRLAQLRKESGKPAVISRQRPVFVIDIEGAGQVPVLGGPNSGKSALVAALTHAPVRVAEYPYTTQRPLPAMMPFEDTQVQLVDTPPASAEFAPPWLAELLRRADAAILTSDLADPGGWEAPAFIVDLLEARGINLVAARLGRGEGLGSVAPGVDDPCLDPEVVEPVAPDSEGKGLTFQVPAILVGTKSDLSEAPSGQQQLLEYFGDRFPMVTSSIEHPDSLEHLRQATFLALHVIRVYSKEPGKAAERSRPWLMREGSTVRDLANLIHHELAAGLRYGRLWGSGRFEGQRVGEEYVLSDEDLIEIHTG
ncbi:MAG: TGS domain-containing protein [Acidobacteriota bacterium]